jgi:integrase
MGLGQFPGVTLAQARDKARHARDQIERGQDPIVERERAQLELKAAQAKTITFKAAAETYIEAKSAEWVNKKHTAQWTRTLETYAFPNIGHLNIGDIQQEHILAVLQPIWTTKTETATRVRSRIEHVLDWARVRGYRSGDNPARWRGHLDQLLPAPGKITMVKHHPAVPVSEVQLFYAALRQKKGMSARALEFALLTAARSGEVRGATWPEIDLDARLWTIPSERMKARKRHRVPLSDAAVKLLRALPDAQGTDLVFPSARSTALSDMSLSELMRGMKLHYVPHGLRSTFRDWVAECTNYPREVAEHALAHALTNPVEAAYHRSDMLEKRRSLMQLWAKFLAAPVAPAKVVPLAKRA